MNHFLKTSILEEISPSFKVSSNTVQLEQTTPLFSCIILLGTMCTTVRTGTNHNQSIIWYIKAFFSSSTAPALLSSRGVKQRSVARPLTLLPNGVENNRKSFTFSARQISLPIFQLTFQSSLCNTHKQDSFKRELSIRQEKRQQKEKPK